MSIPVIITDGNTNLEFGAGGLPVDLGVTIVGGAIPVAADLTGVTVNATFPDTVNANVTNNITVNDVKTTVNVSLTGSKDVTGNVAVSGGTINALIASANVTGNLPVDIKAFSDALTINDVTSTVNVSLTGSKDVTGNIIVSQGTASNLKAQVTGTVAISGTPDVTGNVAVSGGTVNVATASGNLAVDIKAFNDTLNIAGVDTTVNVAVTGTPNVAVTNTPNVAVTSAPTVNVTVLNNDDIHPAVDSGFYDAFGRTRVSNPVTLFQSMLVADNGSQFWDELETGTANGTTSTWTQNTASVALTVNASVNTTRVRQTFERFPYQPGKSQQVMITFVPGTTINGVNKEVGYGDEYDGLFFQTINNGFGFCRRTTANGTTVDNYVAQANWNLDTLDGDGPSGYTLDTTKTQILFIDFEWLGVGRARMGFVIDGKIIYCHAFNNTNNLTTVYMRTPVLPLRYAISGNSTQAASSTLTAICASVATEGGEDIVGRPRGVSSGTSNIVATANWTILKAIRIGAGGKSARPRNIEADVVCTDTNAVAEYCLMLQPTVAGGSLSWSAVGGSQMEQATGNASLYASDGTVLHTAYVAGRAMDGAGSEARIALGFTINGTQRVLALCARSISGTADLHGAINWIEV